MKYFKYATPKKESILNAKAGKKFVTPNNKEYVFNYKKEGRKYIFIIEYKGYKMQVTESEYNKTDTDILLESMEKGILIN